MIRNDTLEKKMKKRTNGIFDPCERTKKLTNDKGERNKWDFGPLENRGQYKVRIGGVSHPDSLIIVFIRARSIARRDVRTNVSR